ncbi:S-adenosyl-L-methionine-dependent methyltransferase [Pilobolus umbonatus]|nr:S-adenosyl-L-methionine-dependent methyltransferase [Pilobolus umbonatus]
MDSKAASLLGTSTTDHSRPSNMSTIRNDNESHYQCIDDRYYWKGNSTVDFSLPCDTTEGERLATMHHMFKSILQGNFISPVRDVLSNTRANVLDIGCGNGTWVLEMSNEFPNTEFFGIDECPLFPKSNKPPNTHFVQHNVLSPFPFNANQFDFIYMRSMILYYTPAQLVTLLSDISRILKPGGYLEVLDTTYMINKPGSLSDSLINHQCKCVISYHEKKMKILIPIHSIQYTSIAAFIK